MPVSAEGEMSGKQIFIAAVKLIFVVFYKG